MRKRFLRFFLGLVGIVLLASLAIILSMIFSTRAFRYSAVRDLPSRPVAIVFGAGVRRDGSLTPMLADRVNMAADLYKSGKVQKILMTGDNSSPDYDEVTNMQRFAEQDGIPASVITLDYAGFSTYESCYRAKTIFGVTSAITVTQRYHQPRAVYDCRTLGIDAVGISLPDWERYSSKMPLYTVREIGAQLKAWIQLNITHPKPTFLGKYEGLK